MLHLAKLGRLARFVIPAVLLGLGFNVPARADVTVLLEEPYALDGEIAGTGHTAVYLSNVCAATPTRLRRCEPGETGVVLSRYHRIAGYDWLAVPLLPYLYAVERAEDIPLFADPEIAAALRDAYRRKYFEELVPDAPEGEAPRGDWYELVGSAFDRTLYGFQFATSLDKDDAFIAEYNARANRMAYKLVTSNCADFVREVMNFYYPGAATRSFFADLEVATPKHVAKSVVSYAHRHPNVGFSAFVIPQIPGSIKRSTPVHGVVDTVFKAKKYEIPLLVFHPIVGGGFALAYVMGGRFNPAQNALMYSPTGALEPPLSESQRRAYAKGLEELLRSNADGILVKPAPGKNVNGKSSPWRELQAKGRFATDAADRPVLTMPASGDGNALAGDAALTTATFVGLTRDNILNSTVPAVLTRDLLIGRLRQELRKGTSPHTSERELRADLDVLEQLLAAQNRTVAAAALASDAER